MLRRGALSTSAGLYHPDWPHTNSNPQNLNQRCPLQISSQALFLEGPQLHLAADAVKSDSQDKERKSSKSGLDFSQRPGAHHEQIHNQDHLDTISPNSQFSKKFSIFLQQLSQLQKRSKNTAVREFIELIQQALGAHCWLLMESNFCFMRGRIKLMSHNITSSKDREAAK